MAPRTRIVLAITVTAAALLLPGSAMAAGWVATADLPTAAPVSALKLAADPTGNEVALWVEKSATFSVVAAYRPVGGTWTTQTLDSTATTQPSIDLAVDPSGNFIALYSEVIGANSKVFSAYLPAGQTSFGASQQFGSTAATLTGIAVALASDGTAWAVFGIQGAPGVGGFRPAGAASTWTINSTGLPSDSALNMDLAVSSGVPTLADYPGAGGALRHTRWNGTSWTTITTPAGAGNPIGTVIIAPDAAGGTTTLYQVASTWTQLGTQSCPAGTTAATKCTSRTTLQLTASTSTLTPSLAVDPAGDAVAVWVEAGAVAFASRPAATGVWGTPTQIASGATPVVGFDSNAGLMALETEGGTAIRYLFGPTGALAPPSLQLTDPTQAWTTPRLAADGTGDMFGAWLSSTGTTIETSVYDVHPPTTPTMAAPTSPVAGSPVTFSAGASDTWSPVTYSWDFGDGQTATGASVAHTYASGGTYTAGVTATDAAGNSASQTQTVQVAAAPTPPPAAPSTLPPPVLGKFIDVYVLKDPVFYKLPSQGKHGRFQRLIGQAQVPNGTVIDTRRGRVLVVIDNGHGGTDSAQFYDGIFEINQPKSLKGLANIFLDGGGFKGCAKAPANPHAQLSQSKPSPHRSIRHLWGSGTGKFRTVGRFAAAAVRGTKWLTDDRCDGTLVRVAAGKVAVRDFVKQKTVLVKAPHKYFARAR